MRRFKPHYQLTPFLASALLNKPLVHPFSLIAIASTVIPCQGSEAWIRFSQGSTVEAPSGISTRQVYPHGVAYVGRFFEPSECQSIFFTTLWSSERRANETDQTPMVSTFNHKFNHTKTTQQGRHKKSNISSIPCIVVLLFLLQKNL